MIWAGLGLVTAGTAALIVLVIKWRAHFPEIHILSMVFLLIGQWITPDEPATWVTVLISFAYSLAIAIAAQRTFLLRSAGALISREHVPAAIVLILGLAGVAAVWS